MAENKNNDVVFIHNGINVNPENQFFAQVMYLISSKGKIGVSWNSPLIKNLWQDACEILKQSADLSDYTNKQLIQFAKDSYLNWYASITEGNWEVARIPNAYPLHSIPPNYWMVGVFDIWLEQL